MGSSNPNSIRSGMATPQVARTNSGFRVYRRMLGQARPYWLHLLSAFLLSALASPLSLLTPVPLKIVVDSAIGNRPLPSYLTGPFPQNPSPPSTAILALGIVLLIAANFLLQLQDLSATWMGTYTGEKLVLDFRARLFSHVQRL